MILKYKISIAAVVSLMIVGLSMGLVFGLKNNDDDDDDNRRLSTVSCSVNSKYFDPRFYTIGSTDKKGCKLTREFKVNYVDDTFEMDGKPFRYVAGSFHYFRALPQTWRSKLRTMRAAGLNAVDLYVQWSLHNPKDNIYNWEGIANITDILQAAVDEDLYVILRPGPYICAEIDNGGLPYWLLGKYPNIQVRTRDADYMREVEKWYGQLLPKVENYLYGNGGPIILVQVENEYGAFGKCDNVYKEFLRDQTEKYVNGKAVLFTVDRPIDDELTCGKIDGVFITTDFGLSTDAEVDSYWRKLREVQEHGPLVNTEFYTGWLTHWQEENQRRPAEPLAKTLEKMLKDGANVDFYMFFGGTNFGFWAGANDWGIGNYMADITSYDYDAPMDEAGDPTNKYLLFRSIISEYMELPNVPVPDKTPKMTLNSVKLNPVNSLLSSVGRTNLGTTPRQANKLWTFEELDQNSGFVLYETNLPDFTRDPSELTIEGLRDRALIYVDDLFVGVLSRENGIKKLPICAGFGRKLQILVENQGRINFQIADDFKGILGNVTIQIYHEPYYKLLTDWTITGYPFEYYSDIEKFLTSAAGTQAISIHPKGLLIEGPVIFEANFNIDRPATEIYDTYIDVSNGWGKGVLYVNGINLGRYWALVAPQVTMYIPKDALKAGDNKIVMLEYQRVPTDGLMNFVDRPNLDKSNVI